MSLQRFEKNRSIGVNLNIFCGENVKIDTESREISLGFSKILRYVSSNPHTDYETLSHILIRLVSAEPEFMRPERQHGIPEGEDYSRFQSAENVDAKNARSQEG